jgi:hypothetical protein
MKLILFVLLVAVLLELWRVWDVECIMDRLADDEADIATLISHDCARTKQGLKDYREIKKLKKLAETP